MASQLLRSGELGELLNISGTVWQDWGSNTANTWRQEPEISGGGFLFDTGAHMLNTVCDLAGEDFAEVAAWFDNRGKPVDILGAVMGRLKSGGLVTINACGDTIPSCESELYVFCSKAIIRTGQWGERLLIQRHGKKRLQKVDLPPMRGAWEQFAAVRRGEIPNPCPPEVGLRMAKLWDAIRSSASQNGKVVQVGA
jgi:predicted dehydrogenase